MLSGSGVSGQKPPEECAKHGGWWSNTAGVLSGTLWAQGPEHDSDPAQVGEPLHTQLAEAQLHRFSTPMSWWMDSNLFDLQHGCELHVKVHTREITSMSVGRGPSIGLISRKPAQSAAWFLQNQPC